MNKKTRSRLLMLSFVLGIVGLGFLSKGQRWHYSFHRKWESPDGKYVVNVYRNNLYGMIPVAPGGGSDGPGLVELVEVGTGDVLEETDLDTLQQLLVVRWTSSECWLSGRNLPSWPLP